MSTIPKTAKGQIKEIPGIKTATWSLSADKSYSKNNNIRTRILSFSTPGFASISHPEGSAATVRSIDTYCAGLRDDDPEGIGFFATLPSLEHTALALQEMRSAFDTLRADGVILFIRYGNDDDKDGYLGHPDYIPVWEELNRREAVVLVHPCNGRNGNIFNEHLPGPTFDWPHETGRTAMDLIVNGRLRQFPNVKIILSHAGGTLPLLARRSTLISTPEFSNFGDVMSAEEILEQARSFYFGLALSGCAEVLPLILGFAKKGYVLFRSEFPHATVPFSEMYTNFIDEYEMEDAVRKEVYYGAAERLFPRLKALY